MPWFTKPTENIETAPRLTPLEQLELLQQLRRKAKVAFDRDWKTLNAYLHANPPLRKPFSLNDKDFFVPVNFLANVPAQQRALETQVAASKARWNALMEQEADLLRRFGKIK